LQPFLTKAGSDGAALAHVPLKRLIVQVRNGEPTIPFLVPREAFERSLAGSQEDHCNFILRQQRILLN